MRLTHRITHWLQKRGLLANPESWITRHFGGRAAESGVQVTEQNSLNATAVLASVRLISGTIASLPLPVYRRLDPRGKVRDNTRPEYKLLHDRPNPEISSFQWRQTGVAHQLLYGDWFSEIEYTRGKPSALWPIPPWLVKIGVTPDGNIFYEVTLPDGGTKTIPSWQMLHVKNLSIDGLKGMSCIRAGAEAIGLSIAAEEFGARFFGQGANVGGIVEYPGKLSDQALENYKKSVQEGYSGLGKAHRLMLLEEGLKYHRVGIPPNEAQFLETRKFQVAEIGRLFGISQLHKIGDLDRATFSNIEQQSIDFVVDTIRPHIVNIEQEVNYKLFNEKDHFTEFVIDGLLRGDTQARYQAYSVARQWGWMSANDVRELENMNPLEGEQGDIYMIPMNMIPASDAVRNGDENDGGVEVKGADKPQETALNGAQITSLLQLLQQVTDNQINPDTARITLEVAFPTLTKDVIEKMVSTAADFDRPVIEEDLRSFGIKGNARGRAGTTRAETAKRYEDMFQNAAQKVIARENSHVKKALKKHLGERSLQTFDDWLEDFYREFTPFVDKTMRPAVMGLAEAIRSLAAQEVNADPGDIKETIDNYMEAQNKAHTTRSRAVIKQLVARAEDENLDVFDTVTERLDEWEEKRAGQIANDSVVAVSNKVAKTVFVGAGIQRLRWVAIGADTCELCQSLNNKVVGIDQPFVAEDDSVDGENTSPLVVRKPTLEPPLHKGCVCEIVPD